MAEIYNGMDNTVVNGTDYNDFIEIYGYNVTVKGGAGNDTIHHNYATGNNTIIGGTGDDSIQLDNYYDLQSKYVSIIYNSGDGNDIIEGFDADDTLIAYYKDSYYKRTSGDDVIVYVDDGKITLSGAAILRYTNVDFRKTETIDEPKTDSKLITLTEGNDTYNNYVEGATINALGGNDKVTNSGASVSVNLGDGADYITNSGKYVTIVGGASGDELYTDSLSAHVLIEGGSGDDSIHTYLSDYSTVRGGAGKETIWNSGNYAYIDGGADEDSILTYYNNVTVDGGTGNDSIGVNSSGRNTSINGGAGNDFIHHWGFGSTLKGGAGDDSIYLGNISSKDLIDYTTGDGNDYIVGFNTLSTLQIGGGTGTYSLQTSGSDIIVTVGTGKITLVSAASLSAVNISGTKAVAETNKWTLDGTTAKYGTSEKTLVTVKGVKSVDGLKVNNKVVTVSKASLNAKKITISGDGYTLALADDVSKPSKKKNWSLSGTTATYKQTKTAGYTLANNAKSITYSKKSTTTLATVKGVKSTDGLSISGKVITVAKSAVNKKKITLTSDDYTLKLADGLAPTTKKAAWSYKNGTAIYKSSYNTDGYNLAKNSKSISYSKATKPSTLATVKGAKSKGGLSVSGKKITLKNSALKNKVTVSGGYEFDFAKDYGTATITGSSKADTITARGKKISVNGGKGDDTIKFLGTTTTVSGGAGADIFYYKSNGSNVISDYAAEDKISIASGTAATSTSGDDLILTVGSGKITITGGANETVTYFDADGEHIYKKSSDTLEGVKFTKSGKVVTLTDDYEADKFDVADFGNYKNKIVTINAAKVSQALEIIGNKKSNVITGTTDKDKIYGLTGADTIRGGKGGDYIEGGDGDDEIYGGEGSDSLWGGDGDDILTGGAGKDFFIYEGNDDGNDTITDYADIDSIMILSGEKPALAYTPQSNNMTFNIGNGSIVIENPQGQNINFVKGDGTYLHHEAVIRSAH